MLYPLSYGRRPLTIRRNRVATPSEISAAAINNQRDDSVPVSGRALCIGLVVVVTLACAPIDAIATGVVVVTTVDGLGTATHGPAATSVGALPATYVATSEFDVVEMA